MAVAAEPPGGWASGRWCWLYPYQRPHVLGTLVLCHDALAGRVRFPPSHSTTPCPTPHFQTTVQDGEEEEVLYPSDAGAGGSGGAGDSSSAPAWYEDPSFVRWKMSEGSQSHQLVVPSPPVPPLHLSPPHLCMLSAFRDRYDTPQPLHRPSRSVTHTQAALMRAKRQLVALQV
jgi:hypothetical protein